MKAADKAEHGASHTPGPWTATRYNAHFPESGSLVGFTVYATDSEAVAGDIYREADARLIAAAPRMLEVLKRMTDDKRRRSKFDRMADQTDARAILRDVEG